MIFSQLEIKPIHMTKTTSKFAVKMNTAWHAGIWFQLKQ